MKRPLLWTILWFAFGEVNYLIVNSFGKGSLIWILVTCLVFSGTFAYLKKFDKKFNYKKTCVVFSVMFILGFCWSVIRLSGVRSVAGDFVRDDGRNAAGMSCYGQVEEISNNKVLIDVFYTKVDNQEINGNYKVNVNLSDKSKQERKQETNFGSVTIGQFVSIKGTMHEYELPTNPGAFDSKRYYENRRIVGYFKESEIDVKIYDSVSFYHKYLNLLQDIRRAASDVLYRVTDTDTASILTGIILGDKTDIEKETKRLYQLNGIAHILAISGLHISLIGGFLYKLARWIGVRFLGSAVLAIFFTISYGLMTGFKVATARAVIMLIISLFGQVLGRTYDLPTGMAIALFFVLIDNPGMILDGGAQLSFGAIAGVILAQYLTKRILNKKLLNKEIFKHKILGKKILKGLITSIIFSFSVNVITLPIICYIYYEFPLYSLILNLIVVPLMTIVVLSGILTLVSSFLCIGLANLGVFDVEAYTAICGLAIKPAEWILKGYDRLCNVFISLPGSRVNTGAITVLQVVVYYVFVATIIYLISEGTVRKIKMTLYKMTYVYPTMKKLRVVICLCIVVLVLVGGIMEWLAGNVIISNRGGYGECIVFLDVGQGDGTLIRTQKGTNIVVDGGSSSVGSDTLAEYAIMPALKYMRMATVDYWYITHTDADHMNGLSEIITEGKTTGIKIKNLVLSKYIQKDSETQFLIKLANENGINIVWTYPGAQLSDGAFRLVTCHPDEKFEANDDKNKASLALAYYSENMSVLLLADMDAEAIEYMLNNESERQYILGNNRDNTLQNNRAHIGDYSGTNNGANSGIYNGQATIFDYIKIPHHGSKNSLTPRLYEEYKFKNAVISCGKRNRYGHPHREVIEELEKENINILRTDESGAVIVR